MTAPPAITTSRLVLIAIVAVAALLSVVSAILFQAPASLGREKVLTDFDAFYVAGTMANEGHAAGTYSAAEMLVAQQTFSGTSSFMPWTYPPPFTLFVQGLALLPVGWAYLLFIWATFAFYLAVLRRIAGAQLPGVLIAILPTIVLMMRTGQNGFLTAGLIGSFLLAFHGKRAAAGVPLGLMIIKPHLAAGIALLALLGRRWMTVTVAAAIVAAVLLVSTAAFGVGIWAAWFGGVREAGQFLAQGYYPLFRMTSVYASVRSFGLSASLALGFQAIGALGGIGLLLYAWAGKLEPRVLAAATCAASLFVSPYSYDYDLAILGIAVAFVLPLILERARPRELLGLVLLSWLATGYGLGFNIALEGLGYGAAGAKLGADLWPSFGAAALLLLLAASCAILRREPLRVSTDPPEVAGSPGSEPDTPMRLSLQADHRERWRGA